MKLLFITDLYPLDFDNPAEQNTPKTLYNFVQCWKNSNSDVVVIKPNFILNSFLRKKPFYNTGFYDDVLNINYWTPFLFDSDKKLQKLFRIETYKPDVIVSHMPSGILFAHKLAEKYKIPFVCGVHISDLEILTNPMYSVYFKHKLKEALKSANAVFCRSQALRKKLLNIMPYLENKTFTAPSGIDENIITKRFDDTKRFRNKIKVLTCAKLIKRKNIDKIIEAVNNLDDFELTVIGDGPERKKLEKLSRKVNFTGFLEHNKVIEMMKQSDVFVLASEHETFGMVYLEALASGCITVCTKNDGIDGIITDSENGFLTLPFSNEIRKTLLNIKNMDDESLKVLLYNSYNTIINYTNKKCGEKYLQQILRFCKDLTPQ